MKKIILKIGGMTCSACSNGLEKYLNKQEGIISASVNLVMATAQVEYDEQKAQNKQREILKQGVFTEEAAEKKKNDLIQVVERGTASDMKIDGITIAGKTGTIIQLTEK